jgi:hypothetical protein
LTPQRGQERHNDHGAHPQAELEQLKNEVSVQRLVEASGVELKKGGKDLIGKCPFHEDEKARRRADRLGDQEQGRELPARH